MRTSGYGSLRVGLRHSFSENKQVEGEGLDWPM